MTLCGIERIKNDVFQNCNLLCYACLSNNETFEFLLNLGINFNEENDNGDRPIRFVIEFGTSEMLNMMLERNVDIYFKNKVGENILLWGLKKHQYELCEKIIEMGVNIMDIHSNGYTHLELYVATEWSFGKAEIEFLKFLKSKNINLKGIIPNGTDLVVAIYSRTRPELREEMEKLLTK